MRIAVLRFPGTWSERDFVHALSLVGAEAEIVWHADADLHGFDAAIVPGGFAYGDYVRAGAIARISPAAAELRRAAAEGMPILGSCNGFQILCEIGLLPGALVRNRHLEFRCDWVHLRVEREDTPFTAGLGGAILRMPIAHGEGSGSRTRGPSNGWRRMGKWRSATWMPGAPPRPRRTRTGARPASPAW